VQYIEWTQCSQLQTTQISLVYGYCNGNGRSLFVEYWWWFPVWRLQVNTYLPEYTIGWEKWAIHISTRECPVQPATGEEDILHTVECSPKTSVWSISRQTGTPQLGLYPYHVQYVQALQPQDYTACLQFCHWIATHHYLYQYILFTDEGQFIWDEINNTHNKHIWSGTNPHSAMETHFRHQFWTFGVISLGSTYSNHWTGHYSPYTWPARSPGLMPLDHLRVHLKNFVYHQKL
jgi:hypothetical protein